MTNEEFIFSQDQKEAARKFWAHDEENLVEEFDSTGNIDHKRDIVEKRETFLRNLSKFIREAH